RTARPKAIPVGDRPRSSSVSTPCGTPWNARSTASNNTGQWPPGTTSSPSATWPPSASPRSTCGYQAAAYKTRSSRDARCVAELCEKGTVPNGSVPFSLGRVLTANRHTRIDVQHAAGEDTAGFRDEEQDRVRDVRRLDHRVLRQQGLHGIDQIGVGLHHSEQLRILGYHRRCAIGRGDPVHPNIVLRKVIRIRLHQSGNTEFGGRVGIVAT